MRAKKRRNNNNTTLDDSDDLVIEEQKKQWYLEISDDPLDFKLATDESIISFKEEAKKCLDSEVVNYSMKSSKSNSDYQWMKTATLKGTSSDRIAACTILIQDNPVTHLDMLRNLVSMVKVGKKNECIVVIDTLTELFLTSLLKPNSKLTPFYQRPLTSLSEISSGNATTRRKYLMYWYFEDQLKEIYTSFILALNKAAQDTVDANKEKAIGAMYKLLAGNPEQEKNLLIHIVNKLGDPSQKVASKAIYCLNQLLFQHINMQTVVLGEIEKLLFRPNVSIKAQYYAICFLSQFYLSHESAAIAKKLIELYFAFFKLCIKKGEVDSRMMSALLMGVNRAYPYAKLEAGKFTEHIDTMYRVVHIANFNVSLHALMLLYQVSDYSNSVSDRFYSALYKKLLDPKLLTTTHQAMFLNLIYKALMKDNEIMRIKAFIKRLLQLTLLIQPQFGCSILYLVSQLMSRKSNLQAIELQVDVGVNKFDDNEEEKYADVLDNDTVIKVEDDIEDLPGAQTTTNNDEELEEKPDVEILDMSMKQGSSWFHCATVIKGEKKDPTMYNPLTRNPLYSGTNHSAYIELLHLTHHYHPTVSLYAQRILEGTPINYEGDPLKDFSLIKFLDRFVFKNPKKLVSTNGSHPTFGIRKKYRPIGLRSLAVNSEKYLQEEETNIPVDELFLYKYMQRRVTDAKSPEDDSDIESVASEEFEEMLDKMSGHKELDEDLDYMNDIGSALKTKSKKSEKNIDEESDASEDSNISDDDSDIGGHHEDSDEIDSDNDDMAEDDELIQDLDDEDNMSDMVFGSDDDDEKYLKLKKNLKNKGDLNSVFASAEEFASLLEDEGISSKPSGTSSALSNKDNAAVKQIAWEETRNRWLHGYNKAIGKKGDKKYNKKRTKNHKFNNRPKKQKV